MGCVEKIRRRQMMPESRRICWTLISLVEAIGGVIKTETDSEISTQLQRHLGGNVAKWQPLAHGECSNPTRGSPGVIVFGCDLKYRAMFPTPNHYHFLNQRAAF